MYHYLYSNDMRIASLEEKTETFAKMFLTDSVPSAKEDKSENNNAMTVGYYLNLANKGAMAEMASIGKFRCVILNFINTFQFPNPRNKQNLFDSMEDKIRIAPLREIIKILFLLEQINSDEAYLVDTEILDFIFYNENFAKTLDVDRIQIVKDIINNRRGKEHESKIAPSSERIWNQEGRQIRELLKVLAWSGFTIFESGKMFLKKPEDANIIHKAEFYDILIYEGYWTPNLKHKLDWNKKSYADYCDKQLLRMCSMTDNQENAHAVKRTEYIHDSYQRIFFGAPGTGKSFKLNQEAEKYFGRDYERVTFHPNYMYGNFVGAFKPYPRYLKDEKGNILTDRHGNKEEVITYKYVEGPLMRILVKALKNPNENYLLIIEEINRANTAAVFGDFFQLLDRNEKGESEYPISTSEDVRIFLDNALIDTDESVEKYIKEKIGEEYDRLVLPENLYIWATMNSADQGVMPMDTAFKRRWDFTYIGIDEALDDPKIAEEFEGYKFNISKDRIAKWNDFRIQINKRLSDCRVPEDKLVGPYFISKSVLDSGDTDLITGTIKNKVLMYLYDDAGKPYRNNLFVAEKSSTYTTLCKNFDENGNAIFKKPLDLGRDIIKDSSTYDIDKEDKIDGIVAENNGLSKE